MRSWKLRLPRAAAPCECSVALLLRCAPGMQSFIPPNNSREINVTSPMVGVIGYAAVSPQQPRLPSIYDPFTAGVRFTLLDNVMSTAQQGAVPPSLGFTTRLDFTNVTFLAADVSWGHLHSGKSAVQDYFTLPLRGTVCFVDTCASTLLCN